MRLWIWVLAVVMVWGMVGAAGAESVVFIVSTTHMDMDYTQPPSNSMRLYDQFIAEAIRLLEEDERLRYSIAIGSAAEHFLRNHPDMTERFGALVKQGRLEICANWSNPHWSELAGELIVRQVAGTQWWVHDRCGVWLSVADNGELADPTPQLAQVLTGCEVPYFHSAKITQWGGRYEGMAAIFWYAALDGTTVLWDSQFYNMGKRRTVKLWDWPENARAARQALAKVGVGNVKLYTDGGVNWDDAFPQYEKMTKFVDAWEEQRSEARGQFKFGTYSEYFDAVAAQPQAKSLPLWTGQTEHGELLYRWGWNKCRDRATFVNTARDAETLAAVCDMYGLMEYPAQELEQLWLDISYVSTHNWGNQDRRTQEYPAIAAKALARAEAIVAKCATLLAAACGEDVRINTLCFERDGVGGIGWKAPAKAEAAKVEGQEISNEFYRVRAKEGAGLVSVFDKRKKRELLRPLANGAVLQLRCSLDEGMGAERATVKALSIEEGKLARELMDKYEAGFVCERVEAEADSLVLSGVIGDMAGRITVRLAGDAVEMRFETTEQYKPDSEKMGRALAELLAGGPMYFASVEFDMPTDSYCRVSVPFGSVAMPTKMPEVGDGGGFSQAVREAKGWYVAFNEGWHVPLESIVAARAALPYWFDIYDADNDFGISWAQRAPYANMFRDKKHLTRFHKSLWRGDSSGGSYVWSFRSHRGNWQKTTAARFAADLNHSLISAQAEKAGDKLPENVSLLEVEPANVVATCFKKAHDGRGYILRLNETADKATEVTIRCGGPLAKADWEETNMVENKVLRKLSGSLLKVQMRPFEVKTLRVIPADKDAD